MVKKLKLLREYLNIVKEGASFKDKLGISLYIIMLPFNYLYKLTRRHVSQSLIFNISLKNEDGIFFCENNIGLICTTSVSYEKDLRKHFNLKEGIFVDIGANIGKYTIKLARSLGQYGKVLAIEPEPSNFKILKKNIKLNKLNNVLLKEMACSNSEGFIDLYLADRDKGGHSIYKKTKNKISVKTSKLDTILHDLKIKKVDLIKIDAEWAEVDILKGSREILKKSHPKIIFEAWNDEHLKMIKEILNEFNYKIKRIDFRNYVAH